MSTDEYIEGTATGEFTIIINGYTSSATGYTITPDAAGKGRWDKPKDLVITTLYKMFDAKSVVTSIDKGTVDTSTADSMNSMFNNGINLTALDVSNFDTSNVEYMNNMFFNCNRLTALDVSNFDTSKVTNMSYMFSNCSNLTALDVSKWDLSNVTGMNKMFEDCQKLKTVTAAENEKLAAALAEDGFVWTYSDGAYRRP